MGTKYLVEIDLQTMGDLPGAVSGLETKALSAERAVSSMVGAASHAGSVFGSMAGALEWAASKAWDVTKALGSAGLGLVAAGAVYGVGKLNAELETTKTSLAAVFGSQGLTANVDQGLGVAADVIAKMRVDAQALPGEFEDLLGIFRTGSVPAFRAGLDVKSWESLSAKVMATAKATSVPMEQAAREFAGLLEGRAGAHNTFGMRLLGLSGASAEKFNKSDPAARLKTLTSELDKYGKYIDEFGKTWDAVWSTSQDNAKQFIQQATQPLFEEAKGTLSDINTWFAENKGLVGSWAHYIGQKLVDAFNWGKAKIVEWWPLVSNFAEKAWERLTKLWDDVKPGVMKLGEVLQGALKDPNGTIDKLITLGKLWVALKVAEGATNAFMGGAQTAMGVLPFIPALAGGAGLGGGAAAAGGAAAGGAGLVGAVGAAAVPAGAALLALGGAAAVVWQSMELGNDIAKDAAQDAKARRGWADREIAAMVKNADDIGVATDKYGMVMEQASQKMGPLIEEWERTGSASAEARIKILELGEAAYITAQMLRDVSDERQAKSLQIGDDALARVTAVTTGKMKDLIHGRGEFAPSKKTVKGMGGTNIQKVEIVVTSNQNPERIARLVTDELAKVSRLRRSSRFATNYSTPR